MRLFLKFSLVAIVASFIYVRGMWNIGLSHSFLLQTNIEALAYDEWEGSIYCVGEGNVNCPIGYPRVEYVFELNNLE